MDREFSSQSADRTSIVLVALPIAKLLLHLTFHRGYGWFRDEFYYIACSERLAWGYVDQPPLSLFLLRGFRTLFGDSVLAVRFLPALAGAVTVLLIGLMARRLGGGRFAQGLAMTAGLIAPNYLALNFFFSMNAFDILFWALAAYLIIILLQGADPRWWLVLGAVLGLGLENKISVLWLGFGIFVGLLATSKRTLFLTRWPWAAAAIALVFFVPHLLWQVGNDWPTLEFIRNATTEKMARIGFGDFLYTQIRMMNRATVPIWLAGLGFLFFHRDGRRFRLLGWAYLAIFFLLALPGTSRAGYLSPAYTWLFAGGSVLAERYFDRLRWSWLKPASFLVLLAGGVIYAPFALPVLPVNSYITYADRMGVRPSTAEKKEVAALGQFYADMHGWEEIVATVAGVYRSLPPEEREKATIFTYNYGDAGAIEFLGKKHGLPSSISGHNNYWLWGPRDFNGEVVIILGGSEAGHLRRYASVEQAASIDCGYCMPYENHRPVWIARGLKEPIQAIWADLKHYD